METYEYLSGSDISGSIQGILVIVLCLLPILAIVSIFLPSTGRIFTIKDEFGEIITIPKGAIKTEEVDPIRINAKLKQKLITTIIIWLVNLAFCYSFLVFLAVLIIPVTTLILLIHILIYNSQYKKISNNE